MDVHGQQLAAIAQQPLHIGEAAQLLGIRAGGLPLLAIQLQLHGRQPLLNLHQPLGERMDGLGQVFGVAADPKRQRVKSHRHDSGEADHSTDPGGSQGDIPPGSGALDRYVGIRPRDRLPMTIAHRCQPLRRNRAQARMGVALVGALGAAMLSSLPGLAQTQQAAAAADSQPGAKGAQVYCFMRASGNDHQVSWAAAYAVIKRQSDRLFKTSPEHAAVMITETVVQNPDAYPDCSRYIGDLFRKPEVQPDAGAAGNKTGVTRSERLGQ